MPQGLMTTSEREPPVVKGRSRPKADGGNRQKSAKRKHSFVSVKDEMKQVSTSCADHHLFPIRNEPTIE